MHLLLHLLLELLLGLLLRLLYLLRLLLCLLRLLLHLLHCVVDGLLPVGYLSSASSSVHIHVTIVGHLVDQLLEMVS